MLMHYSFDNLLFFKVGIQEIELSVLRNLMSLTLHVFIVNNIPTFRENKPPRVDHICACHGCHEPKSESHLKCKIHFVVVWMCMSWLP